MTTQSDWIEQCAAVADACMAAAIDRLLIAGGAGASSDPLRLQYLAGHANAAAAIATTLRSLIQKETDHA